jgi:hypothetical protein
MRPTQRAPDLGYAPRFLSVSLALGFSRFDSESTLPPQAGNANRWALAQKTKGEGLRHENISPEFNSTDALLLYSISYCQRHDQKVTLAKVLVTTDAINRSFPMVHELEDGFSRLIVNRYIDYQEELFTATKMGLRLFNETTQPQSPKLTVFQQIENLTAKLNISRVDSVSKQLSLTDKQVSEAIQEAQAIFREIDEKAKGLS